MSLTPISADYSANYPTTSTSSGNFFDYLNLGLEALGPAALESVAYGSGTTSAAYGISSAAINGLFASSSSYASGSYGGGLSYLSSASSLSPYAMSYSSSASDLESMLQESAISQAYLIGIQSQLGMQQTTFTSVSNALNMKHQGERSAIQNFKV